MHSEYSINGFGKAGRKRLFSRMALFFVVAVLLAAANPFPVAASRGLSVRPVAPDGKIVSGNNWLFVIGINDYQHWPKLKTAVNDAKAVKEVLVSRYDFEADHVIELYDRDATEAAIIARLRALASQVKENDSLMIFYAGHGHLDSITKEGSWVPVESATDNASAWISNHAIKNYLKVDAIRARHILLVSDSCFSGGFFRGRRGSLPAVTPALIKKAWQRTSRQAISSGGLEPVADAGFGDHSVFSYFFIKALKENRRPYLIPSDLFAEVRAGVAQNAEQFPSLGVLSDTGGQAGGEFVFMLRQGARIEDLSAAEKDKMKELEALRALEKQARLAEEQEKREIAAKEQELAALDAKIAAMQKRLGTTAQTGNDSLDTMLAMVQQKEAEQKKVEDLKKQKTVAEAKRQAEIARLKKEQRDKTRAALEMDIKKYRQIVDSLFGQSMAESAWNSLVQKYAPGKKVAQGDEWNLYYETVGVGPAQFTNFLGMTFVWIDPGTFPMGSPPSESGRENQECQHRVTLSKGFYMQNTEVTQGQWQSIMGDNPSEFSSCGDDCPVENVSWNDVQKFIRKLNHRTGQDYRLPTEAEWEYACRAESPSAYANGDMQEAGCGHDPNLDKKGWYCGNSTLPSFIQAYREANTYTRKWSAEALSDYIYENDADFQNKFTIDEFREVSGANAEIYKRKTPAIGAIGRGLTHGRKQPVALKQPNVWGLYDMHGNVWEWCADYYEVYSSGSVLDPAGPSRGSDRVNRGGSWDDSARYCRSAFRNSNAPGKRYGNLGFRLVCPVQ